MRKDKLSIRAPYSHTVQYTWSCSRGHRGITGTVPCTRVQHQQAIVLYVQRSEMLRQSSGPSSERPCQKVSGRSAVRAHAAHLPRGCLCLMLSQNRHRFLRAWRRAQVEQSLLLANALREWRARPRPGSLCAHIRQAPTPARRGELPAREPNAPLGHQGASASRGAHAPRRRGAQPCPACALDGARRQ